MTREYNEIVVELVKFIFDRVSESIPVACIEIRSANAESEQCVSGENDLVCSEAYASFGMTGSLNDP